MYDQAWGSDDGTEPEGDDRLWWYPPPMSAEEKNRESGWIYKCHRCEVTWKDRLDKRISCWVCGRFVKKRHARTPY